MGFDQLNEDIKTIQWLPRFFAKLRPPFFNFLWQVQDNGGKLADNLFLGITEHLLGTLVEDGDHPFSVSGDDGNFRGGIQNSLELHIGGSQGGLGIFPVPVAAAAVPDNNFCGTSVRPGR